MILDVWRILFWSDLQSAVAHSVRLLSRLRNYLQAGVHWQGIFLLVVELGGRDVLQCAIPWIVGGSHDIATGG